MTCEPIIEDTPAGTRIVFKRSAPTPAHAKLHRVEIFPAVEDRWVWAVAVRHDGAVIVDYCEHDPVRAQRTERPAEPYQGVKEAGRD